MENLKDRLKQGEIIIFDNGLLCEQSQSDDFRSAELSFYKNNKHQWANGFKILFNGQPLSFKTFKAFENKLNQLTTDFNLELNNFETIKNTMDFNGCYWANDAEFLAKSKNPCYIPENAETLQDVYSYIDLQKAVEEWAQDNPDYLIEHETTTESILINMYENLSWESPSTFLDQLNY